MERFSIKGRGMAEKGLRIITGEGRVIAQEEVFKKKEDFHKEQARLSFEEKIRILVRLQEIASKIKDKGVVWKLQAKPY